MHGSNGRRYDAEDLFGASDDPLGRVLHQLRQSIGPPGDVGGAVIAGVEADRIAHDVSDRLDLYFLDLSATQRPVSAQERVAELVDEGLEGLCGRHVGTNGDLLLQEAAVAVLVLRLRSVSSLRARSCDLDGKIFNRESFAVE